MVVKKRNELELQTNLAVAQSDAAAAANWAIASQNMATGAALIGGGLSPFHPQRAICPAGISHKLHAG